MYAEASPQRKRSQFIRAGAQVSIVLSIVHHDIETLLSMPDAGKQTERIQADPWDVVWIN